MIYDTAINAYGEIEIFKIRALLNTSTVPSSKLGNGTGGRMYNRIVLWLRKFY